MKKLYAAEIVMKLLDSYSTVSLETRSWRFQMPSSVFLKWNAECVLWMFFNSENKKNKHIICYFLS